MRGGNKRRRKRPPLTPTLSPCRKRHGERETTLRRSGNALAPPSRSETPFNPSSIVLGHPAIVFRSVPASRGSRPQGDVECSRRIEVMVASHRSIIAGAVLLVASAAGANADYYGGMKDMPVATIQPASWYVRGDYRLLLDGRGRSQRRHHPLRLPLARPQLGDRRRHRLLLRPRHPRRRHLRLPLQDRRARRRRLHHRLRPQELGDPGQPLLRLPPLRALHPLPRRRRRRRAPQHQRRHHHTVCGVCCPYDGDEQLVGSRRPDGGLQHPPRSRLATPPSASRTAPSTQSPAACTSMSATASSTWAMRTPATSSAPRSPRPARASTT